jgi:peptide/nickel transport system ATP-binding protein/oligopeptide transport system ATP-binding protein
MATEPPLLTVEGLTKHYLPGGRRRGVVHALDGVDLAVVPGETFGIVGESGCGKSTLGRCVLRLETPTAGSVWFNGENVLSADRKSLRRLRREMQIVLQDPFSSLDPRQTVNGIVGEPLIVHTDLSGTKRREKIEALLSVVGLRPEYRNRYPHEFSGGQRQRICIARALALNPKLVIADEPVSALDVSIQAQILNLLAELQERFQLTYIFISHDLSVIRHLCERVAVMYLGQIVETARAAELFQKPHHPYTEALISAVPVANPRWKKDRILLEGDVPSPVRPPTGCRFHPRCPYRRADCDDLVPELVETTSGRWVACRYPLV